MTVLHQLVICQTQIRTIESTTFPPLESMRRLNLSGNQIQIIGRGSFRNLQGLEELDLSSNQLMTLGADGIDGLELKLLDVSRNPWTCECELTDLVQWLRTFTSENGNKTLSNSLITACAKPLNVAGLALWNLSDMCLTSTLSNAYLITRHTTAADSQGTLAGITVGSMLLFFAQKKLFMYPEENHHIQRFSLEPESDNKIILSQDLDEAGERESGAKTGRKSRRHPDEQTEQKESNKDSMAEQPPIRMNKLCFTQHLPTYYNDSCKDPSCAETPVYGTPASHSSMDDKHYLKLSAQVLQEHRDSDLTAANGKGKSRMLADKENLFDSITSFPNDKGGESDEARPGEPDQNEIRLSATTFKTEKLTSTEEKTGEAPVLPLLSSERRHAATYCNGEAKLNKQITQLPRSYFWDGMKNLQFLNLHDNAIGNNIEFLSSCQSLIGLTLYDTPLSLRESYRHCIINSIWSLKALDNYVVSDEEIIEDWSLPQKFKAQTPNLFVDLCPVTKMNLKYEFCIPSCGSEKNIAIDLEKLLQSDIVQAKESEKESYSLNSERNLKRNTPYCTPVQSHLFEDSKTKPKWNKGESDSEKYDLDELGFRLPGSKAFFHQADPVREMLISHRENGREIRFAIDQFHSASQDAAAKPKINYCPPVSMEKRLIARSYASISLTPFQVIEKAYRDRQKAENLNLKADWVAQARVTRVEAQNHIKGYLETRNSSALNKSEKDSLQLQEAMERHKTNDSKLIQLARQRHARFLEEKKQRAAENAQVKDVISQNISISNAMLKYKILERKYALRQEKIDLVMTCKLKQEERMQLVHKYMEHRKLAIQTEAHFEKMAIDSRLVQKANDRLKQVRAKVASQKAHRATLVAMQPVPVDQIPI
ncbi:UNVERIFIED_CONTAM: hypothetical protein FKN15_001869 [Acipenser sinensis]